MDLKSYELLFTIVLIIHIVSGSICLIMGLGAIVSKKGKRRHILSGRIFYYSMNTVSGSAVVMSLIKSNEFLLMIGVFSFYLNFMGYRSVKNKSLKPSVADWVVVGLGLTNGVAMILSGNIVLMFFSGLSIFLILGDLKTFVLVLRGKELLKTEWLVHHIGRMIGAYIATSTAFLVVNINNVQPAWLFWILPTVLGAPLIAYYTKKFAAPKKKVRV